MVTLISIACVIIAIMINMLSLQTVAKFLISGFIHGIAHCFVNWTNNIIDITLGI